MVIDPSALIAILQDEPGSRVVLRKILSATEVKMASPSTVELQAVLARYGNPSEHLVRRLLHDYSIKVVDFTAEHAAIARRAYLDFGRGSGHRAKLNFGNCFSYALAIAENEPLLFVGNDFAATDVLVA